MGAGHDHTRELPAADDFTGHDTARLLRRITIGCAIVIILASAVLWPSRQQTADPLGLRAVPINAHVTTVEN